jgi:glycosyltransferase involved in cell wall biosynthesis
VSEQPSVSVVINNYNYGRFLGRCVDSALRQTAECEVIVVEDGSTDESSLVLAEFGDNITVVRQQNKGQAAAMNSGVQRASGNIIAFLDSDDFMHADRVERVRAVFAGDRAIEWLRHDMTVVDEAGRTLRESLYPAHRSDTPLADVIAFGDTWGATSGLCFSRALFEKIGPIPEETYRYSGDGYLIVAGALVGRCITLAESLSARRLHSSQITNRRRPTPGYVRNLIEMRAHKASTASRLAAEGPEAACMRQGATWWQRKAALQSTRLDGKPLHARFGPWRDYASSLFESPLPSWEKVALILRDTGLAIAPERSFEALWWWTHDGRPILRHGWRRPNDRHDESSPLGGR